MRLDAVVKFGGSLHEVGAASSTLAELVSLSRSSKLLVVPGGGPFADAVRRACAGADPGPSAAHWMAVLAMDQTAHQLAALQPGVALATGPAGIEAALAARRLPVLAPYAWLREVDPLPHGWHVTSDSIAAWVAAELGAARLVLFKVVEGVQDAHGEPLPEADPFSAIQAGVVDAHFAQALPRELECWILDGRQPSRLRDLLSQGRARGTRLQPHAGGA